jgi:ankyrin repeat protein
MLLPDDVLSRVLSELSAVELVTSVPLVCRRWHRLAKDSLLWLQVGCTKLDEIISQGRLSAVQVLIARDAITQEQGDSALAKGLARAVVERKVELVRRLLKAGVSAKTRTPVKNKSLLSRLTRGSADYQALQVADLLLAHGACIDSEPVSDTQRTLLERAARHGDRTMVGWLLKNGAKPVLRETMVKTNLTRREGRKNMLKAIKACSRLVDTALVKQAAARQAAEKAAARQAAKRAKELRDEERDDEKDKDYVDDDEEDDEDD